MAAVVLACKAAVAVLLIAAGGAKLADVPAFAASVRLFLPGWSAPWRAVAAGLACGEAAAGAASLSSPSAGWLNLAVLAICAGLAAVAAVGYARHPGQPCRCFGGLSGRGFGRAGVARSAIIAACAAVAVIPVRASLIRLGPGDRLGLLAGAALVAVAAYSAAAAAPAGSGGSSPRASTAGGSGGSSPRAGTVSAGRSA